MRKHREIYLHSIRMSVQCIRKSVQCIQAKTTWLPTLRVTLILCKLLPLYVVKYSKTSVKRPLSKRPIVFKTNYRSIQVKSIAECSHVSILQYFRPSLSNHLSLRSLFCLFLRGPFYACFTVTLIFRLEQLEANMIFKHDYLLLM